MGGNDNTVQTGGDMKPAIQLRAYGSLREVMRAKDVSPLRVEIDDPTPFPEILKKFNIPLDKVQLIMVNHKAVQQDSMIHPGDRLTLFPREYPIFVDWYDYRRRASSV
jgi:hypothetical protein